MKVICMIMLLFGLATACGVDPSPSQTLPPDGGSEVAHATTEPAVAAPAGEGGLPPPDDGSALAQDSVASDPEADADGSASGDPAEGTALGEPAASVSGNIRNGEASEGGTPPSGNAPASGDAAVLDGSPIDPGSSGESEAPAWESLASGTTEPTLEAVLPLLEQKWGAGSVAASNAYTAEDKYLILRLCIREIPGAGYIHMQELFEISPDGWRFSGTFSVVHFEDLESCRNYFP